MYRITQDNLDQTEQWMKARTNGLSPLIST